MNKQLHREVFMPADELQRHAAALLYLSFDCTEQVMALEIRKIAYALTALATREAPTRLSATKARSAG
jgi:hypothetical protein